MLQCSVDMHTDAAKARSQVTYSSLSLCKNIGVWVGLWLGAWALQFEDEFGRLN